MECKKCGPSIFDIAGVVIALAIATIVTIFFAQGAIPGMIIFTIIAFVVSTIMLLNLIAVSSIIGILVEDVEIVIDVFVVMVKDF